MIVNCNNVRYVTPGCCSSGVSVRLGYTFDIADLYPQKEVKPQWVISTISFNYGETLIEVFHCPVCGQKLPEIVKRKKHTNKICQYKDGGYRCDTCDERLMSCKCSPPWIAWEPKK